jgi:hypothetical protein
MSPFKIACLSALALLGGVLAADPSPVPPLYRAMSVTTLLNDKRVREDLKVTKEQEKAILAKSWGWIKVIKFEEQDKITGPDKEARIRALQMKWADTSFAAAGKILKPGQVNRLKQVMLQELGMTLFDHPEVRAALGLDERQVQALRTRYEKLKEDSVKEIRAKGLSPAEVRKKYDQLPFGVPEVVREMLDEARRKRLNAMLGEQYLFNR